MNKQEAIKKTEELEKQLAELKAIIEAPETSELVFKPKYDQRYDFVNDKGQIVPMLNTNDMADKRRLKVGNVFRECEAHNSAKYYIMNSDYDYWFPWSGQPKPNVLPKGLEFWDDGIGFWKYNIDMISSLRVYRWKRSVQGEK